MLVYELEGKSIMITNKPCVYCENAYKCKVKVEKCREADFSAFHAKKYPFNEKEHKSYNNSLKQNLSELRLLIMSAKMPFESAMKIDSTINNMISDSELLSTHTIEFREEVKQEAYRYIKKELNSDN